MAIVARSWLKPSAALTRLAPPVDALLETLVPVQATTNRYGYRIGDIGFLVPPDTSSEVMDMLPVYELPNTPNWLLGLANVRGNLVPVFDLKRLLNIDSDRSLKSMLLVIGEADRAAGVIIDGLPLCPDLTHKLSQPPPLSTALRDYIRSAYIKDGRPWLELDHHGFFRALATRGQGQTAAAV